MDKKLIKPLLVILLVSSLLTLFFVGRRIFFRIKADVQTDTALGIEAENGTVLSSASIGADSSASGGQFVFFGQPRASPTINPTVTSVTGNSPTPHPSSPILENVIYVSPSGNDANPGILALPLKTIGKAVQSVKPGDTVRIKPGTYRENVKLTGKNGLPNSPVRIMGDSLDPLSYPVVDGGDSGFLSTIGNPAFNITNSSWLVFERIKIINSTEDGFYVDNSHYITIRRNIINFHRHGIRLKNNSSHLLVEYNEMFQSYPKTMTWSKLKGSKWEGGAYSSFGGAGMTVIRNNYFHDLVNGVVLYNGGRVGNYYDANVWIYNNRFENIVDDPYEPESYAFNNHFFGNTLINTHRMVSLAPSGSGYLGPIYIHNNVQIVVSDPTGEAQTGRINSAFKVDLSSSFYANGVYAFNNSIDISEAGLNGYGVDFLDSTVNNFNHKNNAYIIEKTVFNKTGLVLKNSSLDYDISKGSLGFSEPHGFSNTDPQFTDYKAEDLRLKSISPARGKSQSLSFSQGFTLSMVVPAGADLGAFQYGQNDFRKAPDPVYIVPPGGEHVSFPSNVSWPVDLEGGHNPQSGPKWKQVF